jgi:hypothetical protein
MFIILGNAVITFLCILTIYLFPWKDIDIDRHVLYDLVYIIL